MLITPLFNPSARIDVVSFDAQLFCLVIDDALLHPEQIREFATQRPGDFKAVDFNFYPGSYLPAPPALTGDLAAYFQFHARKHFDARRCLQTTCRYSLVTTPPPVLHPHQRICHRDDTGLDPALSMQACVLFLFDEPALGGTAFYLPRRTPAEMRVLFADAGRLAPATFSAKYGLGPGYMDAGNDWFRRLGGVEAKWNRLILYDGGMFHTGDIRQPERLSADPRTGRLTLNGFFTSRRHVSGAPRGPSAVSR